MESTAAPTVVRWWRWRRCRGTRESAASTIAARIALVWRRSIRPAWLLARLRRRRRVLPARFRARLRLRLRRRRVIAIPSAAIFVTAILRRLLDRLRNEDAAGLRGYNWRRIVAAPVVAISVVAVTAAIAAIAVVHTVVVVAALRWSITVRGATRICLAHVIAANLLVLIRTAIRIVRRTIVLNLVAVTAVLVVIRRVIDKPGRRSNIAVMPR